MISDNNHISYSAEAIRRYWNGQLSPQEMHAMEKAALDDPFLADAMEGMGQALEEHDEQLVNAQLNDLRRQLEARTGEGRRAAPVRSLRKWAAAAAAVAVLALGYWLFTDNFSAKKNLVSKQERAAEDRAVAPAPTSDKATDYLDSPATDTSSISITAGVEAKLQTSVESEKKAKEPGYHQFKTEALKRDADSPSGIVAVPRQNVPSVVDDLKKLQKEQPAAARSSAPISVNFDSLGKPQTEVVSLEEGFFSRQKQAEKTAISDLKLQNIISGVVTDTRNNPLPNAFVRINNNSFTTDPSGNFKFPATDTVVNVSVSLPGYNTQNFRLRSTHDGAGMFDNQIRLQPDNAALNEVAVKKYETKGKKKDSNLAGPFPKVMVQDAQPVYGWLSYDQYLEKNKRIPESNPNLAGEVVVTFFVNRKGELSGFEVEKSLSPDHDAEALRLIRTGPAWKLQKGRKSRVTVIVRF